MATGRIGTNAVLTTRWSKAPAGGTTSLSGLDDNSVSLVYSVGYEQVYLNGALLSRGSDYTATNGTTITLTNATVAGDIVEVFANATVPLTDTYSQTVANGKFINNTLTTTTGDIIYASAANTPARLGIGSTDQVLKVSGGVPAWGAAPAASFVGCQIGNSEGDQNVLSSTYTAITFNDETIDTDSFHSTSTNTSRITIPTGKGGKYLLTAQVFYSTNSTNGRRMLIMKNGAPGTGSNIGETRTGAYSGYWTALTLTVFVTLAAGDYLEIYCWQDSGSTLTIQKGPTYWSYFGAQYLGA